MIAGQLEIQLMANIARLQEDMNKAQNTVDRAMGGIRRSADLAVKALAALGVGLSAAALTGFIRGAIDAADEMSKLSQKIGVGVESVAGLQLAFRQSGISAGALQSSMSRLSREIAAGNDAFNAMGISIRSSDGALKSSRQVLGELADKFAEYEDGVAKTALAMDIFGKAGAELIPLLNGGSAALDEFDSMAAKLGLTLSEETAKRAERFNDTLDLMGQGMHGIGRQIAAEMLPTFNALAEQFFTTLTEGDRLKSISDSLSVALRGLTAAGIGVVGAFQAAGNAIGGVSAMIVRVFEGDFNAARTIAGQLRDDLAGGFRSTIDSMTKAWTAQGSAAFESMAKVNRQIKEQAPLIEKANDGLEKRAGSIRKQVSEADKLAKIEERRIEQLKAEGARLTESIDPLVKRNNEIQRYKTLLESGAISEGIYSQAVERSTEDYLKALGFVEREIESIESSTKKLESTSVQVFDSMEQIAIQGVRNIQSSFADGIFNFFDNGLKGMVNSVVTAVGRIASEFASIKLLQAAGGLLGLGGASTAFASSGGGIGAGLNLASLGSSAMNMFSTGLGATGLIGGGLSALGGASTLGAFGAGLQGGSAGAAFIAAESATAGAGAAAGLGASMGAVAGPLIALAVVDQIGRLLAGNKSTGTFVDSIPVIGGFAGALFGRGPYKFREQQILGNVSAQGFDGEFADVFRSKGGLLVGNKHKRQGVENEDALQELFDTAIKGFADSTRAFADTLGIDADSIDDYTKKIFIRSEKGQRFTEEKIGEILAGISDDFATGLIPTIDELSITGESASQTLQRLSTEFDLLRDAAILFGDSAEIASEKVKSLGLGGQSDFIAQFGGSEKLAAELSEFYNTVFTDSQKLEVVKTRILDVLKPIGIDFIPTLEQLYDAVRSGNPELINAAFQIDALVSDFNQLSAAVGASGEAIKDTADAFKEERKLMQSLADERRSFTSGRRDVQEGRSAGPIIATTIGGRKVTESEIRAMQKAEIDSAAESATALFKEQLSRTSDPQLIKNLNATLEFIKFQSGQKDVAETASRLTDDELTRQAAAQLRSLNSAERAMRNTTFNGSVQFPFPPGTNESADAADKARLAQFDIIKSMIADPAIKVSSAFSDLSEAALDLANDLLLGDKSILSVFQKTSEAQRQYNDVITRARSGSATSSELSRGVNNLLDAQINSASTKFEFDRQFAMVVNDLRGIGQTAEDRRAEEQKKSTAELKAEIKQLRDDLNAANVAITKNTAQTADVLNRWSIVGLPATEV